VTQPTPAIVAQDAVRRLPRLALLLFCLAYVVPGFLGRGPWKNQDITGFGYMLEIARGHARWLAPAMLGQGPEFGALLPYWLGAAAIRIAPAVIAPDLAVRIAYALLLALTLAATWYATYSLARSPLAQPVPFAFGGEAHPRDYARAVSDGALLALVATLGLAQFGHETTPSAAQLAFAALSFYGLAGLRYRLLAPGLALVAGLCGLSLSGAPAMGLFFALGGLAVHLLDRAPGREDDPPAPAWPAALVIVGAGAAAAALAFGLDLWHWRVHDSVRDLEWTAIGKLLVWFTWPAGPIALWTLWRWRRQLLSRHVALPLWFAGVAFGAMLLTDSTDRSLLLALPPLAALAAFALPTLRRSVSALVDWFTLLFFSGCAITIWVIWLSLQTGIPAQPAANVRRLAPGFEPSFSVLAFGAALAATLAWCALVRWRTGRHRQAIWKSFVLPAGGAALCWLLLMTLWLPVLDYARSYQPLVRAVQARMGASQGCVAVAGLTRPQVAALLYHGGMQLEPAASRQAACPWLLVAEPMDPSTPVVIDLHAWQRVERVRRPVDKTESLALYRKVPHR